MEDIIKDLKQIRKDLLFAVEYRDRLLVKFQVNKIDTLINRLSKKLNEGIVNEAPLKFCLHCGTKINSGEFCSKMCRSLDAHTNKI